MDFVQLRRELEKLLLEVEGARAPVPHSNANDHKYDKDRRENNMKIAVAYRNDFWIDLKSLSHMITVVIFVMLSERVPV